MVNTKEKHSESFWKVSRPILISILCGAALLALCLLAAAFVLLKMGQIHPSVTSSIAIGICAVSAILSGLVVGRITKKNGLILGGITGLLLYFLILIVSVCCGIFQFFTISTIIRLIVMIIGGALGGLISVNKRIKVK